eukprot:161838_1
MQFTNIHLPDLSKMSQKQHAAEKQNDDADLDALPPGTQRMNIKKQMNKKDQVNNVDDISQNGESKIVYNMNTIDDAIVIGVDEEIPTAAAPNIVYNMNAIDDTIVVGVDEETRRNEMQKRATFKQKNRPFWIYRC